jgi:TRAP-type C4-dicarboxylate transport system permease small subunit
VSEHHGVGPAQEHVWERRADAVLGMAASLILFCMMTLTFVDVVLRYLFNRPLSGSFEVTELMLLVLIFAGLPLVSHGDEHVTMDFIDHFLLAGARRMLERIVHLLCAGIMFFLAWQVWLKAGKILRYGDTTDVMRVPLAPFVYFMAVMIALTGLVHILRFFITGTRAASQSAA